MDNATGTSSVARESVACGHDKAGYKNPCDLDPAHHGEHANIEGEHWFNYGPVDSYEITWMSGHIETVQAHQVTFPHQGLHMFSGGGDLDTRTDALEVPRIRMHAEIDGRWVMTLAAREEDIRTIRLVTGGEQIPGGAL